MLPSKASADDARLTVTPAVYRVDDSSASGGTIQLVRHHGYYGRSWGGGYRGFRGYGYRGFYRPLYPRPYYRVGPGFGYGYPGYGYGYRGW